MQWSYSWRSTRYKPRKRHAKPALKGCLGSMRRLKGWQKNKQQRQWHKLIHNPHIPNLALPRLEVEDTPHNPMHKPSRTPIISQDDDSTPAENTCKQRQICTLRQDYMLHMMEIPGYKSLRSGTYYSSYATLPLQSWMMTLATYSSTAISSSILSTRTHGARHLGTKSDA